MRKRVRTSGLRSLKTIRFTDTIDELIELILKNSSIFYKALFSVLYKGSLKIGETAIHKA